MDTEDRERIRTFVVDALRESPSSEFKVFPYKSETVSWAKDIHIYASLETSPWAQFLWLEWGVKGADEIAGAIAEVEALIDECVKSER